MAKTYYKYVERGAESQINWGEVGKSVSEMIALEAAAREQKKAAIDESSRQFGEVLSNAPTGDFESASKWTLDYADDASKALLLLDRQLKTGQISVKDYTIKRQNLNDSTNQLFAISKAWQEKYNESIERSRLNGNSGMEMYLINQIEGLSNFKGTKAYINPTNYQVSVGKMIQTKGADGQTVMMLDPNPNNHSTVNQMNAYVHTKVDRFDYTKVVGEKIASLGQYVNTEDISRLAKIYRTYAITDISDPTKRPKFGDEVTDQDLENMSTYEAWEKSTINAILANPYSAQSILYDALGTDKNGANYEYTQDKEQAKSNSKYIYLEDDGSGRVVPELNDEQKNAAYEFLRTQIRNGIDQKSQTQTQAMPSIQYAPNYGNGNKIKTDKVSIYQNANNALRTGNTSALNNDDYVYDVRNVDGNRVISVRPKTSEEKTKGIVNKNKKYTSGGGWTTLFGADDVAPYLTGVGANVRADYIEGRKEFNEAYGFQLFGKYQWDDIKYKYEDIMDPGLYTQEARDIRMYPKGNSGSTPQVPSWMKVGGNQKINTTKYNE